MTRDEALPVLFARMNAGDSVRQVAKDLGTTEGTLRFWANQDPESASQYARAREAQGDAHAEDIDEMAEEARFADKDRAQGLRVAIDAKKWLASKLKPRDYGDKVAVEHSGTVGIEQVLLGIAEKRDTAGHGD